jgi:hypothetical protein
LTHQSASFRASHGETRPYSISRGISTPVWGIETMSGVSPRVMLSQGNRESVVISVE